MDYNQILDLMSAPRILTIDTESGETRGLMGISFSFRGLDDGYYLGWNHDDHNLSPDQKARLGNILDDDRKTLVFHNAAYDLKVLQRNGLVSHRRKNFYDTMLMVHWVNENLKNYSLDRQSQAYGGNPKNRSAAMQYMIDTYGWDGVSFEMNRRYSSNDAFITDELFYKVLPKFQEQGFDGELWEYEQKYVWVIADMVERGVKVDTNFCTRMLLKGTEVMQEIRAELGFNPASPLGLEKLLLDELGLPVVEHTPGGKPSFNKAAMDQYDMMLENVHDPRAKKVLRYRGWQKAVSAYYQAYLNLRDSNNCLHPGYKIHGTVTGRASCEKPNLQQIPKSSAKEWNGDAKSAIIPRDGYGLWEFDYSQLEFRLTCAYAEDQTLLEIFNDSSRDIFDEMSDQMEWERQNVKTLTYLLIFGGGGKRARAAFNLETIEEGQALVKEFYGHYPSIRRVSRQAQQIAQRQGFVKYWTGRRRHFPRGSKYYQAFNSLIQGGESEIIKRAMIKLDEEVCNEDECRMVLQVHDSIVFEIAVGQEHKYFDKITEVMENPDFDFGVQFRVDRKKWGSK